MVNQITNSIFLFNLCYSLIPENKKTCCHLSVDAPKSARRKAERGLPFTVYFTAVTKTTFRGEISAQNIIKTLFCDVMFFGRIVLNRLGF